MKWLLTLAVASFMATTTMEAQEEVHTQEEVHKTHFSIASSDYSKDKGGFNWDGIIENPDAEKPAAYRGGATKLREDISKYLVYPQSAQKDEVQGVVFVQFALNEKGQVVATRILKSLNHDCDLAAVTAIRKLKRFKPAQQKGKSIPVLFNLPVRFSLQ